MSSASPRLDLRADLGLWEVAPADKVLVTKRMAQQRNLAEGVLSGGAAPRRRNRGRAAMKPCIQTTSQR